MSPRRATMISVRTVRWLLCVCGLLGCSRTTNLVSSRARDGGTVEPGRDGGASDAGIDANMPPPFGLSDAGVVLCGEAPCACANGRDDDGDGFIDGFDAECTGPYDQDEATFATGEVKTGNPNCDDCFFDGNPSSQDDGCDVAARCKVDGTFGDAPGSCYTCEPTTRCVNSCLPRTPNGCDCFGCCEVQGTNASLAIQLVDTCSLGVLEDERLCPRCVPSTDCRNACGPCELCPGKTLADLPSECAGVGGPGFTCEDGEVCTNDGECPGLGYCALGCCVPILL